MIIKLASALLIAAGICVIAYPYASDRLEDHRQRELIAEWQDTFYSMDTGDAGEAEGGAGPVPAGVQSGNGTDRVIRTSAEGDFGEYRKSGYENMEGILIIDKIDLKLPILHGATAKNMKTSVASIDHTGQAGQIGNYAIAGHRSLTYGRNFNRLNELEKGDLIEVDTETSRYVYQITDKFIVKPDEVWVLEGDGRDREITLVTCHPLKQSTHRLIIKGKLLDDNSESVGKGAVSGQ